jgi:ADP-heptose:LPS heptosyltransferase
MAAPSADRGGRARQGRPARVPGGDRLPRREPRRILLLAMLPLGDTLFVTPTLRALRARYPHAHIAALTRAGNAPILRPLPIVDEVLVLPALDRPSGLATLPGLIGRLGARRFDVAIDFTSPAYKWISLLAGIPRRTYMKFDPLWWVVPGRHARWRSQHATRLYYDCARELDLPPWEQVDQRPFLHLPPDAQRAAEAFLRARGLAGRPEPIVGVHAGGAGLQGQKRWPAERFAEAADRLAEGWNARILLLGGRDEAALARQVAASMRREALVAAGALPLMASFALIARCDLFLGNDSSLLHAAAAMGTPYVGIFGPTCLANFQPLPARPRQGRLVAPWPPPRHLSYFVGGRPVWQRPRDGEAARALAAITTRMVLDQAEELLARPPAGSRRP